MTGFSEILGVWCAALLTFSIFSYLFRDNPFYKAAEYLFIGISTGYWVSMFFWTQIQPNLFGRLFPKMDFEPEGWLALWYRFYDGLHFLIPSIFPAGGIAKGHELNFTYIIPLVLGVMMMLSIFPKISWFARWGIAYTVGMAAGLRAYGYLNSNILEQVKASTVSLFGGDLPLFSLLRESVFNNILILVGTLCGLLYFYFSREQKGTLGRVARIGVYFLMISFGASFGFAVMGRISLLIGRFTDLIEFASASYHHATFWVLGFMILVLGYWAYKNPEKNRESDNT